MLWLFLALAGGALLAGLMSTLVFRVHDELFWMQPKKACIKCELPRSAWELLPILGDVIMRGRCRSCSASVAWQYPVIEIAVVLLTVFHVWRWQFGIWVPMEADTMLWLWLARDIFFTLFLVAIFVYDLKFSLIMDKYTVPAMVTALVINILLGISGYELVLIMTLLFLFFLLQYTLSGGRLTGSGDVRMGLVMGAMLGFVDGISALLLAYVLGAIVAVYMIGSKRHTMTDRVPFGTFLSVATFILLVWGDQIVELFL